MLWYIRPNGLITISLHLSIFNRVTLLQAHEVNELNFSLGQISHQVNSYSYSSQFTVLVHLGGALQSKLELKWCPVAFEKKVVDKDLWFYTFHIFDIISGID